jgi:hypothetical protein
MLLIVKAMMVRVEFVVDTSENCDFLLTFIIPQTLHTRLSWEASTIGSFDAVALPTVHSLHSYN